MTVQVYLQVGSPALAREIRVADCETEHGISEYVAAEGTINLVVEILQ